MRVMKAVKVKPAFVALCAVAVLSLGLVLSGCGSTASGSDGSSSQDAAKNQFLADRGGNGTPGATGGTTNSGTPVPGGPGGGAQGAQGAQGGGIPGVFGAVQKVDGNKITVKSNMDGAETVVQLADGATIHKQAQAQASDIKVGDTVSASGTKDGDTISVQNVQIGTGGFGFGGRGGFGGFGGPPGASGTPVVRNNGSFPNRTAGTRPNGGNGGFPNGTPPSGFPPGGGQGGFPGGPSASGTPGVPRDFVSGTVEKIDGDTITVKTADSASASFKMAADTRVQKQVEVQASDVKEGNTVVAMGQQNGNVFEASSVQVVEGLPGVQAPTP